MGSIQCCQLITAIVASVILTIIAFVGGCYGPIDIRLALGIYLVVLNILTAIFFWLDKYFAVEKHMRIAEIVLHYMTFFGGPIGAFFGIYCPCCRHKSNKRQFLIVTVVLAFINVCWVFVFFMVTAKNSLSACYK